MLGTMKITFPIPALAFALGLAAGTPAFSHGDEAHAPAAFDASRATQMPFGIAADPSKARRTIRIAMDDTMRYTPSEITVKRGEVVRIQVSNRGGTLHEMVLGTRRELAEHAELMRKFPGMEHDEPYMVHVQPGKTGEMAWRFNRAGEFLYGCLLPGHFEAGMVGTIRVTEH